MPGPWRSYTEVERGEAVGLAMTIGTKAAAAKLGIPRRTLSSWIQRPTDEVQAAIGRTRDDVAARLWEAVTTGTDAVLDGLRDPKARLGEKANALRIVVESHALLTGGPTARTETHVVTPEQREHEQNVEAGAAFLRAIVGASEDELRAYLAEHGVELLQQIAEVEDGRVVG